MCVCVCVHACKHDGLNINVLCARPVICLLMAIHICFHTLVDDQNIRLLTHA